MPATNADNPAAEPAKSTKATRPAASTDKDKTAQKPADLLPAAGSTDPAVQQLVSKRGHIEAAIADGRATEDELDAVDAQLRDLGYTA